ncbi:MAG: site-specific DNA-methyltransferase [Candidatus Hydrogenedentes bacterium]|nr:site-specific DNA-methyltransferase [Candidatus Hydrogenedentota bacterium]
MSSRYRRKTSGRKARETNNVAEAPAKYFAPGQQLSLLEMKPGENGNGGTAFRDTAFADNKILPVHRWVPWIAGYSASFVDDVIFTYLNGASKGVILDPFCGVGTTLLQAVLHGHDAIGFEINPYAALAARAKLSAIQIDLEELDEVLAAMQHSSRRWLNGGSTPLRPPEGFKSRLPFFSPQVERQVLSALRFMARIESKNIADLFRVAFGAVMVSFSNYTYEPSLGSRPGAGKPLITDADVGAALLRKLRSMRADIAWIKEETRGRSLGKEQVVNADFLDDTSALLDASVDLVITSPPYMNNYHYVRNTRPQLYWLNFIAAPKEQQYLENHNFGRFWQTVRQAEPLPLAFEHRPLENMLQELRDTRAEKGAYGGPGWANYVTCYFNDCYRLMSILKRLLKRSGTAVIVIGNSIIQGIDFRTENFLAEIGELQGLALDSIQCVRDKRVGASIVPSSVRHGSQKTGSLSEYAVALRK